MLGWMLYVTVVSTLLSAAAWTAERSAETRRAPTRLYWAMAIVASVCLPIVIASVSIQAPSLDRADERAAPSTAVPLREMTSGVLAPARLLGPARATPHVDGPLIAGWATVSGALALGIALQGGLLLRSKRRWPTARVAGVEVFVSETVGPAVVGLLQPRIVVPRWIVSAPPEDQALIIAHERTHLDADDARLLALAILLVVCMPWNLPLWWQLHRLRLAIEVDCDARVLRGGGDMRRYGETLLMVGARHSSSLAVVAAMSEPRSNLERRLLRMLSRPTRFAWASGAALAALSLALTATAAKVGPPNRTVSVGAATLDRYVGFYDVDQLAVMSVTREGTQLSLQLTGQPPIPAYPRGDGAFSWAGADVRFVADNEGPARAVVLNHEGDNDGMSPRITEAAAAKFQADLLARIERGAPAPGTQAALSHAIAALMAGEPDYNQMEPSLAQVVRAQGGASAVLRNLGPLEGLAFSGVGTAGNDVYVARHAHGASRWSIALNSDGKIHALRVSPWP